MGEKVYQLTYDQIGVVSFDEPWFLIHIDLENDEESKPVQLFYPSLEKGIKAMAVVIEEHVINKWQKEGPEGNQKIEQLRQYLLKSWPEKGLEEVRVLMYEKYGFTELENKTGQELLYDGYDFLAFVIGHIMIAHNNLHFYFEGLHVSCRVVDKFLAVNFWDKVKQEAMSSMGNTKSTL
ncbi:hypothetical protein SHELI_v1c03270 [Spiroplasma helicoides]|uniref:Uncharacterized protein n=1 Tax=Spiroplasma helicoides TaxID=216938 RepID=A0A1B3SK25_9MOLU|nr:hypothetical protein [Spiroplasma helicoides]AOG60282.1 hypothetical protein SHELI_v1c03270 [Spiroplasma helicoides]